MTEQYIFNFQIMTNTKLMQMFYWLLLVVPQSISSTSSKIQFLSFCNQSINIQAPLSIIFSPTSSSPTTCCNTTLDGTSSLSNSFERIIININMSEIVPALQIFNKQMQSINLMNYSVLNKTRVKTDIIDLPVTFSLCQLNIQTFEIKITNISKGPCIPKQYHCSTSNHEDWCIDEVFHCDTYHSCPQGSDETDCSKQPQKSVPTTQRTIRGGVVTTILVFGLLLIIASVSIAVAFLYFQRKRQRRRQFTYSLESTSDDWEPSGTGYHLFDNWTNNRRSTGNTMNNNAIDSNEHMPITTTITNR